MLHFEPQDGKLQICNDFFWYSMNKACPISYAPLLVFFFFFYFWHAISWIHYLRNTSCSSIYLNLNSQILHLPFKKEAKAKLEEDQRALLTRKWNILVKKINNPTLRCNAAASEFRSMFLCKRFFLRSYSNIHYSDLDFST